MTRAARSASRPNTTRVPRRAERDVATELVSPGPSAGPRAAATLQPSAPTAEVGAEAGARQRHRVLPDEDLRAFVRHATDAAERHAVRTPADAYGRAWSFEQAVHNNQAVVLMQMRQGHDVRTQTLQVNMFTPARAEQAIRTLDAALS